MAGTDSDEHYETAAYVCVHVLDGSRDVLLVAHDEDDAWSFQCGDVHALAGDEQVQDASQYFVVGLNHLLDRDPTLHAVRDLDTYEEAERAEVGGEWTRAKFEPEQ